MAGWNGSDRRGNSSPVKPKVTAKKPSPVRGLIAGGVVVVLAAVAYFMFFADSEGPRKVGAEENGGRIKDVGKRNPAKRTEAPAVKSEVAPRKDAVRVGKVETVAEVPQEGVTAGTNAVAEGAEPKKKPVFENGTDQLIAMATGVPEGCTIPPLPNMTPADTDRFIETLKKPIKIDDKDSDAVKAAKERVQQVREQIAQWMQEEPGKELGVILNEHRDDFNHTTEMQNEVKKGLQEYLDANDIEGAQEYLTMMNLALQQVGVPEVEMPRSTSPGLPMPSTKRENTYLKP